MVKNNLVMEESMRIIDGEYMLLEGCLRNLKVVRDVNWLEACSEIQTMLAN